MNRNWNIIGHTRTLLAISSVAVGLAILVMLVWGFRQGIDFTGGTLWQFRIPDASVREIEETFASKLNVEDALVTISSRDGSFLVRVGDLSEAEHQAHLGILTGLFPAFQELGFQSIGPSIGKELRDRAIVGIILVLIGISLYIAFAFRKVSRPVSSWKYGLITLLTLFHDVLIPAGFLSVMGRYYGVEIDSNFVVALLVVMGFSVHDTIVVFDRIRENLSLDRGKTAFRTVVNLSVNQTIGRSVNTSFTLILVLIALIVAGPHNLYYFILTLLIGVTTGIYSSIFVASPLLVLWERARK